MPSSPTHPLTTDHTRRSALATTAAALAWLAGSDKGRAQAQPLPVVASFSILVDFVREIGGDRVSVTTLVGPEADAHAYQPSPGDARTLLEARLVVVNGLGFEGWLARLVKASGTKARIVTASAGVVSIALPDEEGHGHSHGARDPHAWQDVGRAKRYVETIRDALAEADPAGRADYAARAGRYLADLDALDRDIRAAVAAIPPERRKIVTTHDAFGYFAAAYGVTVLAPQGVSTETEASARDVARIIRQVKADKVPAVFLETVSDERLMRRIASETGARIGGKLYPDALSRPDGPAPTYLRMMRHNLAQFAAALTP